MNKEPGMKEVTIHNSDTAKFGTDDERKTFLAEYIKRLAPTLSEKKTAEEKICKRAKDTLKKLEGGVNNKHKRSKHDAISVSSLYSNVLRALKVLMPTMPTRTNFSPQIPSTDSDNKTALQNPTTDSNNDNVQHTVPQPPTKSKRRQPDTTKQPPCKRKRSSPSITESDQSNEYPQTFPFNSNHF